jgi:predicted CXXCH cytochrome family protein
MKTLASSITYSNDTTGTVADLLFDNKVECASCHDVHNTVSATATKLLLIKNDVSKLCLSCHSK